MHISLVVGVPWISLLHYESYGYLSCNRCPRDISSEIGVLCISLL